MPNTRLFRSSRQNVPQFFTSFVHCPQYRLRLCQLYKFFYRHIVNFSRGNFPACFCNLFQASLQETLSLISSALQICQHSALYSKMEFTRFICRLILVFSLMVFGSVDAFIQLICCHTRNVYKSFDVFTTFSVSTDDSSEIFGLLYTFNRFFFTLFDINKLYFFLIFSF